MFEFNKKQLDKISALKEDGIDPYPAGNLRNEPIVSVNAYGEELSVYDLETTELDFPIIGRLMFKNEMGRMGFARLEDHSGRIQIAIRKNDVEPEVFKAWKKLDVGDWVYVNGRLSRTRTGQLTLFAKDLRLHSKCIIGMPDKANGVADKEVLYRQRYLDLAISSESRELFRKRSMIIRIVRAYLESSGYMEFETPILQPIPGGASAKPFVTHHNTLGENRFLRIAPELYLKRLLVGGFPKVYEIGKNFRNEGMSTKHNPEFTMVEFYASNQTYEHLILLISSLIKTLAIEIAGEIQVPWGDSEINFDDIKIMRFDDAIASMGIDDPWDVSQLQKFWVERNGETGEMPETVGGWFTLLFDKYIEPKLNNPTFVTHFPTEISPLARKNDENPLVTDRFELFIGGQEIANGFTELNDPIDQAERFKQQVIRKANGDDEAMYFDEDYIRALSYGMPPAAGAGIGIDRLVMLLTNKESIRDVILFPTMKRV